MIEKEEDYNPYCTVCTACGEDGCCSALACGRGEAPQNLFNIII
jgi:hypothetical protein